MKPPYDTCFSILSKEAAGGYLARFLAEGDGANPLSLVRNDEVHGLSLGRLNVDDQRFFRFMPYFLDNRYGAVAILPDANQKCFLYPIFSVT